MDIKKLNERCCAAVRKSHGHVGNHDQAKPLAKCGGPGICHHCLLELIAPMVARATQDGSVDAGDCACERPRLYEYAMAELLRIQQGTARLQAFIGDMDAELKRQQQEPE